jgi:Kae1-associated kinase Bud32
MMKKAIGSGAEAIIYIENDKLVKERIKKDYRIDEIDYALRKQRTRKEAKIMQKVSFSPQVLDVDEKKMKISMNFIDGDVVRNVLDKLDYEGRKKLCIEIGERVAEMHDMDVIHGDLTTSNMIFNTKLFIIDFGLSLISKKDEDKAVDLHLFKQALESKHWQYYEECYNFFLQGYEKYKDYKNVLKRLEKVERRGRYKGK